MDAELHTFLNLALHGDKRSVSNTGHLTPPSPTTGDPTTHWIGGWVGSTTGMEASPSGNRIHDSWVVRPVVSPYADCCLLVRKIIRRVQFGAFTRRWVSNNFRTAILCYERTICSCWVLVLRSEWVSRELNEFIHLQCNSYGLPTLLPFSYYLKQ